MSHDTDSTTASFELVAAVVLIFVGLAVLSQPFEEAVVIMLYLIAVTNIIWGVIR